MRWSVWTSRAWSAATRSSRFRAANAPAARPAATIPAMTMPDEAEDQHARAQPPPVHAQPVHRSRWYAARCRGGTLGRAAGGDRVERIGFVGLGTMGAAMAANLRRAGFEVTALEPDAGPRRGPGRAGRHGGGHRRPTSPAHRTSSSCCVSDTPDVEAVLFGPDGVADGLAAGGLVIDCSTISPAGHRALRRAPPRARASASSTRPVSGGSEGAQKATLTIFVGGEPADAERARPVLAAMGKTITHFGPAGSGQAVKAVNQVVIAGCLPRRGRGDRARDQGRPRRRRRSRRRWAAGRRAAGSSRTAAAG